MVKLVRFSRETIDCEKNIIKLAVPVFLGFVSSTVYQIVDTFWLARYSYVAAAAAATAAFAENVLYALVLVITMGITVLISNRIGKKNYGEVKLYIVSGWILCFALVLLVSIPGFFLRKEVAGLLVNENSRQIIENLQIILSIIFPGVIVLYSQCMVDSIFHGNNNTKTPMVSAFIANFVNLILDPIFIFGLLGMPKMGVAGAFVATLTGRIVGLCWSVVKLRKLLLIPEMKSIKVKWEFRKSSMEILKIGVPLSLEFLFRMISSVLLLRIISIYGDIQIAAYGIGTKVIVIVTSVFFGIRQASSILLARRSGEGFVRETKLIGKSSAFIAMSVACVSATVLLAGGHNVAWLFTGNVEVVRSCIIVLNYLSIYLISFSVSVSMGGSFIGSGNGRLLLIVTFASVIATVSFCYILSAVLKNVAGVWLGMIFASILQTTLVITFFYKIILPKTLNQESKNISLIS